MLHVTPDAGQRIASVRHDSAIRRSAGSIAICQGPRHCTAPLPPAGAPSNSNGTELRDWRPVTTLSFPVGEIVGTLGWVGAWDPNRGPILATSQVEVPAGAAVSLTVTRVVNTEPMADGWKVVGGPEPVDLGFLVGLPPDSLQSVQLRDVVSTSVRHLTHLAPGVRRLYLAAAGLDDSAIEHVAALTGLTYLQSWGNAFTDAGVQELASLQELEDLHLEEETLTVAALDFVRRLPRLRRLGLQDMTLAARELDDLRARLPGVQI